MKKEKPSLLAKCGRSLVIKRKRQPSASRGQFCSKYMCWCQNQIWSWRREETYIFPHRITWLKRVLHPNKAQFWLQENSVFLPQKASNQTTSYKKCFWYHSIDCVRNEPSQKNIHSGSVLPTSRVSVAVGHMFFAVLWSSTKPGWGRKPEFLTAENLRLEQRGKEGFAPAPIPSEKNSLWKRLLWLRLAAAWSRLHRLCLRSEQAVTYS